MRTPGFRCAFLVFALSASALAQRTGGGRPSTGVPGSTGATNFPSVAPATVGSEIFISGKVVLDDGTELTEPAVIQTICRGRRHSETYSDLRGSFSFRFGDPTQGAAAAISDASSSTVNNQGGRQSSLDLQDCELQAELAEYKDRLLRALAETENVWA